MSNYTLHEVLSKREIKLWLAFPSKLYKNDNHYVRPLDREVEKVFDREQNKLFRHGDATRYYLTDQKGTIVGRIAVFYDEKTSGCMSTKKTVKRQVAAAFSTASTIKKRQTSCSTLPRNG